ncbi:hypothetical protein [Chitinophaga filiformis]|uniref:Uncharacterized protein n=1 Tax=Chitinophaga filiformis TaxID=104663 RepID=A0ABY4IAC5_CHIFI|nr:hypothetical protein [Chitinophaga filiformis]UPK72598.1 hypothetical protein MYF79_14995 [Chitinophaga filiformis]
MKIITLIISVYVLLMAVIPCCSFDNCEGDRHDAPQGICSPFFSCHNCSLPVVLEKTIQIEPVTNIIHTPYTEYRVISLPGYTAKCWNPPRV